MVKKFTDKNRILLLRMTIENYNIYCLHANNFSSTQLRRACQPMEELRAAVTAHLDQVAGLVQALSSELRRGIGPAADNLRAFIRAVDWTVFSPDPPTGDRIRITKTLFPFLSHFQG